MGQKSSSPTVAVPRTSVQYAQPLSARETQREKDRLPDIGALSIEETQNNNNKPLLNPYFRDIISECFNKAPNDMAGRILQRTCQHREDVKAFFAQAGYEVKVQVKEVLQNYLQEVIAHLDDSELVKKLSHDYGRAHVPLRLLGFKPDFFAALADSIASECVFMGADTAAQAPTNTFKAWTVLVGVMFSSVRDGYYCELRKQRRQSPTDSMDRVQTPLGKTKDSKNSTSLDSNASSTNGSDDAQKSTTQDSRSKSRSLSTHSNSPLCSAPESPQSEVMPAPTKTKPKLHTTKASSAASGKIDQAKRSSGSRTSTAMTQASSCETISSAEKSPSGFYRTTHRSYDLPTQSHLIGRFQKNVSLDCDNKRRRVTEKKHANLARKRSSSTNSVFDPNSVIDRFMRDQL